MEVVDPGDGVGMAACLPRNSAICGADLGGASAHRALLVRGPSATRPHTAKFTSRKSCEKRASRYSFDIESQMQLSASGFPARPRTFHMPMQLAWPAAGQSHT